MASAPSLPAARGLSGWWRDQRDRGRLRPRALVLLAVVLLHIGLLLAVLLARAPRVAVEAPPIVVRLLPPPAAAPAPAPPQRTKAVTKPAAIRIPKPIVDVPKIKPAPPALFTTEMMEAVDISKLPSHKAEASADGSTGTGPPDSTTAYGPGAGPGGAKLYNAEWYREPTDAEIAPYMAKTHLEGGGTADIACRTIEHYGVEDCVELGESPPGSGLSRAIRQAAWQFKVRPPRIGGKSEIGAWVRIHYVITVAAKDAG